LAAAWGFAPDPTVGAYSAPPDPLAGFKVLLLRGFEGREGREGMVCLVLKLPPATPLNAHINLICYEVVVRYSD